MELAGKVIIFSSEEEAKIWFKTIGLATEKGIYESLRLEMESRTENTKKESVGNDTVGNLPS